jgi:hypothetical protein
LRALSGSPENQRGWRNHLFRFWSETVPTALSIPFAGGGAQVYDNLLGLMPKRGGEDGDRDRD